MYIILLCVESLSQTLSVTAAGRGRLISSGSISSSSITTSKCRRDIIIILRPATAVVDIKKIYYFDVVNAETFCHWTWKYIRGAKKTKTTTIGIQLCEAAYITLMQCAGVRRGAGLIDISPERCYKYNIIQYTPTGIWWVFIFTGTFYRSQKYRKHWCHRGWGINCYIILYDFHDQLQFLDCIQLRG